MIPEDDSQPAQTENNMNDTHQPNHDYDLWRDYMDEMEKHHRARGSLAYISGLLKGQTPGFEQVTLKLINETIVDALARKL
jgi:hypothetical protein